MELTIYFDICSVNCRCIGAAFSTDLRKLYYSAHFNSIVLEHQTKHSVDFLCKNAVKFLHLHETENISRKMWKITEKPQD